MQATANGMLFPVSPTLLRSLKNENEAKMKYYIQNKLNTCDEKISSGEEDQPNVQIIKANVSTRHSTSTPGDPVLYRPRRKIVTISNITGQPVKRDGARPPEPVKLSRSNILEEALHTTEEQQRLQMQMTQSLTSRGSGTAALQTARPSQNELIKSRNDFVAAKNEEAERAKIPADGIMDITIRPSRVRVFHPSRKSPAFAPALTQKPPRTPNHVLTRSSAWKS